MANHNPNLVKINRSYTLEELAAVLTVHKNTVSSWVKSGLPCLKERRPFLILGADARAYLKEKRRHKKQTCKTDEFFCMRCKLPVKPAVNFVEYLPLSATKGQLTGFCSRCECVVNKFVNHASLARYSALFDLTKPKGLEDKVARTSDAFLSKSPKFNVQNDAGALSSIVQRKAKFKVNNQEESLRINDTNNPL